MSSAKKVEPRAYILNNCQKRNCKYEKEERSVRYSIFQHRDVHQTWGIEDFNLYAIINEKRNGKIRQFNAMLLIIKYFSSKLLEIIYE